VNHVTIAQKPVTIEEIIALTLLKPQYSPLKKMNSITISPQKNTIQSVWNDPSIPMVSVLVHELRNPLTNIMLTIHLLESKILDDNDRMYMDIIKRSSAKINDLVNDLLKGQQPPEPETEKYSIHQMLDEVIEMASDKIKLKRNYAPYDLKIKMDMPKIKIALTNIIINAIDAMSSENGELRLGTKLIKGKCAVSIQDNGSGISKENLPLIFTPYFTNKKNGVGVGLAATKDILLSNKVGVRVESSIGYGTRFILLFEKNRSIAERKSVKIHQPVIRQNRTPVLIECEA
jgi:signal transduction histidine kinase